MRKLAITLQRPSPSGKAPKESVLYVLRPETQYTCEKCLFRRDEATKCALFSAAEPIKPNGSCGFWIHFSPEKAGIDMAPIGAVTKQEAGYADSKHGFSCKRCKFFDPLALKCQKVDENSLGDTPGVIHPNACCNMFDPDPSRGQMSTEDVNKVIGRK
jgi:hypothetical protein